MSTDDRFMEYLNTALDDAIAATAVDLAQYAKDGASAIEKESGVTSKTVTSVILNGETTFL